MSRTDGCSTISMIATTYGTSTVGRFSHREHDGDYYTQPKIETETFIEETREERTALGVPLSLEIGDYNLPGVPRSAELIQSIVEQGYDAFEYRDGTFVKHRLADGYAYDNLIFMPSRP